MALSFDNTTNGFRAKMQRRWMVLSAVTLDATYPAGGWPITAANFGLSRIDALVVLGNPGGGSFAWDKANSKILAYYSDNNNAADALLIEIAVGDTAILSTMVAYVMVWGV